MNHCLPAIEEIWTAALDCNARMAMMVLQTSRPQNLGDTVLLVQECLLVHLVQQAGLAIPARDRLQIFQSLLLWPNITHLYHDQ